jgi:serine protease AprX
MSSITKMKRLATVAVAAVLVAPLGAGPAEASDTSDGSSSGLLGLVGGVLNLTGGVLDLTLGLVGQTGIIGSEWGDDDGQGERATRNGSWDASIDLGSMYNLTRSVGAQRAWAQGVTGRGVTVALIDTGVAPVPGLDAPGKVLHGPDLSYESQTPATRYLDGYGHGTHMAGIIAGADAGLDPRRPVSGKFAGIAPGAQLLNMKVAAGDGGVDVSQVIAALDWVVEHRKDAGMNVRVANLSYGTESLQSWQSDPLARAVENAWNHGIFVVASAGNSGLRSPTLLMPARDPHIMAVGAVDHNGSASKLDDKVADFTNGGRAGRRPDLLAPGKSVVSLRVPKSFVDLVHPEGRLAGDSAGRFFRGSGTSQAAAVVAGEAALLFQANPKLTPDRVKAVLLQTARPLVVNRSPAQGAGVTDVGTAVTRVMSRLRLPRLRASYPASSGLGSLEASRGGEHVVDPMNGVELSGEVDALGSPWKPAAWTAAQDTGSTWVNGAWNGRTWTGSAWQDGKVLAAPWTGASWSGLPWADHVWSGDRWEARSWRGDDWEARSWREDSWEARSWRETP